MSEYVLGNELYGPGGGAGSDSEYDDDTNRVTLAQDLRTKGAKKGAQSAIRLAEIGPRMTLRSSRVEAGLADGDVLYHAYVKKVSRRVSQTKGKHEEADALRAERREEQEHNVALKRQSLRRRRRGKWQGGKHEGRSRCGGSSGRSRRQ